VLSVLSNTGLYLCWAVAGAVPLRLVAGESAALALQAALIAGAVVSPLVMVCEKLERHLRVPISSKSTCRPRAARRSTRAAVHPGQPHRQPNSRRPMAVWSAARAGCAHRGLSAASAVALQEHQELARPRLGHVPRLGAAPLPGPRRPRSLNAPDLVEHSRHRRHPADLPRRQERPGNPMGATTPSKRSPGLEPPGPVKRVLSTVTSTVTVTAALIGRSSAS
jgi:hypothetical protein